MSVKTEYQHWQGSMVWEGRQFAETDKWLIQLGTDELKVIKQAVEASKASGKPIGSLTQHDFPFDEGSLGQQLDHWRNEILIGCGYLVLRGLESLGLDDEEMIRAYWGIGTWIGEAVPQNGKAHLLGHVIDQRADAKAGTRIYQTNQAQPFHSDSCDIVGLLCLRQAKTGGASAIASSAAIHNTLLKEDPQALDTLYDSFQCDRYDEIPEGKDAWYAINVFNRINGQLVCCGMDPDIRSAQRLDKVERLTDSQLHALDSFQATAKKLALNMTLQRGDIQLVNNLTVVHARTAFEDFPDLQHRRYMVRLWLSSKQGRQLPEFLSERWGNIACGSIRGGIRVAGATPIVELNPDS